MSAPCPQILPNVVLGQISDFFQYVLIRMKKLSVLKAAEQKFRNCEKGTKFEKIFYLGTSKQLTFESRLSPLIKRRIEPINSDTYYILLWLQNTFAGMFGGFSSTFYSSYHQLIPKEPGFEQRHLLYKLFHNLNHWNHFGGGYKSGSLSIMKKLIWNSKINWN